jgi:osmotically-inducible protein OsmY
MKSDSDIKRDVEEELRFDPDIDATDIGVAVKDGVVTLVSSKATRKNSKPKPQRSAWRA